LTPNRLGGSVNRCYLTIVLHFGFAEPMSTLAFAIDHPARPVHTAAMKRVTGIGGIFFKSKDPDQLREWYRAHLGIEAEKDGGAMFKWRRSDDPERESCTVWSPFPSDTKYFAPSEKPFMINFQVENRDETLAQLKCEGVEVDPNVENYDYGKFGWIMDPEGNRIELWEPPRATQ
jgi:predicted enzyme related to lactoylglutathione lyase